MINRRNFLQSSSLSIPALCGIHNAQSRQPGKPNIILIVADDLGYGELGCFGQDKIKTPHLDQLAGEGMKLTQFYSGQAVCAPSRCVLMTGKHTGHAYIRSNREVKPEGQLPIPDDSYTIAEMMKQQGYATGAMGKWGLGPVGSSGDPNNQGLDLFFGYNCQRHAHNYYPRYLYKNEEKIPLPGNDRGLTGERYAADEMIVEALDFIRQNKDHPFFLYYPTPVPHLALQVPEDSMEQYIGKWDDPAYDGSDGYLPHPTPKAAYAGMISRMDRDIGRMMKLLEELGLDENTLVLFTSDNGATHLKGPGVEFFNSNGGLRGKKGSLYEGGIRVPTIARWKGKIVPGTQTNHTSAFWDIMPTLADIAGGKAAEDTDGISFAPTLLGEGKQKEHDYLYWEFPSYGGQQAVRMGDWKGIRQNLQRKQGDKSWQLYNIKNDRNETTDVVNEHPEIIRQIKQIAASARVPSEEFPFPALDG